MAKNSLLKLGSWVLVNGGCIGLIFIDENYYSANISFFLEPWIVELHTEHTGRSDNSTSTLSMGQSHKNLTLMPVQYAIQSAPSREDVCNLGV